MAISKISPVVFLALVALFSALVSAQEAPAPAPGLDRGAASSLPVATSMALLFASFFFSLPALLKL
ncbi:hypothetical protein Csa_015584 [Cucumis sativus]|uniref:Uncharacterized protein n=1 Tax=Cucumis sativus TaxID=3659 RepID=A0A0A0K9T6_CUCSA|nr:hypothetical protein Csa_015584 [Cucumis sativus]